MGSHVSGWPWLVNPCKNDSSVHCQREGKQRIQIQLSQRLICPIRLLGKCQMMVFWVSTPRSTVVLFMSCLHVQGDLSSSDTKVTARRKRVDWAVSRILANQSYWKESLQPMQLRVPSEVDGPEKGHLPHLEFSAPIHLAQVLSSSCTINPLPLPSHFCIHLNQTVTIKMKAACSSKTWDQPTILESVQTQKAVIWITPAVKT